jgi:hypothetical protein
VDAVVAVVGGDANDFVPAALGGGTDALADGLGRVAPKLAGEALGDNDVRTRLEGVGPSEVAAGRQTVAHRLEEAR